MWKMQDVCKGEDYNYTEDTEGIKQTHFPLQYTLAAKN